jgi:hypothetical protein
MIIVKTLEEIVNKIDEDYRNENGYYMSIYPEMFALKVAKEIRRLTIQEIANTAEVVVVDFEYDLQKNPNPIWGVDSDKILNLDLNTMQIW